MTCTKSISKSAVLPRFIPYFICILLLLLCWIVELSSLLWNWRDPERTLSFYVFLWIIKVFCSRSSNSSSSSSRRRRKRSTPKLLIQQSPKWFSAIGKAHTRPSPVSQNGLPHATFETILFLMPPLKQFHLTMLIIFLIFRTNSAVIVVSRLHSLWCSKTLNWQSTVLPQWQRVNCRTGDG